MLLHTHDIFDHEQEINALRDKLQTCTMESDDYGRCADIFQVLGDTAKTIADKLRGEGEVKDAPQSYFAKFQLGTKLYRLQSDIVEIVSICNKLKKATPKNREWDLYDILDKYTTRMTTQLVHIKQTLPPSTKKSIRKPSWKAKRLKSLKAQEPVESNETEQECYPRFSNTTLGYSLNDE